MGRWLILKTLTTNPDFRKSWSSLKIKKYNSGFERLWSLVYQDETKRKFRSIDFIGNKSNWIHRLWWVKGVVRNRWEFEKEWNGFRRETEKEWMAGTVEISRNCKPYKFSTTSPSLCYFKLQKLVCRGKTWAVFCIGNGFSYNFPLYKKI